MAPNEVKGRKRKGTVESAPKPKKQKKAEDAMKTTKSSAKALKSAVAPLDDIAVKSKPSKKKVKEPSPKSAVEEDDSIHDEDDIEDVDDQTAALLAGFESEGDESDLDKQDKGEIAEEPKDIPAKARKALKKLPKAASNDEPGVVFLGRIPHGFYEPQMKAYFNQFGKVNRLRLSRSKKTGGSKHYAFIEFASSEVADIVARTMNTYLMFGHILQCKVIPPQQVHEKLFDGANQRFKRVPRNKMVGAEMARGAERQVWDKRIEAETTRRRGRSRALKEKLGYEFVAPKLKSVDQVPKKALTVTDAATEQLLLEAAPAKEISQTLTIESQPDEVSVTETVKVKKPKKKASRSMK